MGWKAIMEYRVIWQFSGGQAWATIAPLTEDQAIAHAAGLKAGRVAKPKEMEGQEVVAVKVQKRQVIDGEAKAWKEYGDN